MSAVVDNLITHPNVMNGAMLSAPSAGMQYVEGYALDEFCAGRFESKNNNMSGLLAASLTEVHGLTEVQSRRGHIFHMKNWLVMTDYILHSIPFLFVAKRVYYFLK